MWKANNQQQQHIENMLQIHRQQFIVVAKPKPEHFSSCHTVTKPIMVMKCAVFHLDNAIRKNWWQQKIRLSITNYMAKHTIHLLEILIIVIYFTRKESHMPHGKQKHINSNNQTTKKDAFSPIRCINFVKCTRVDLLLCKQNNACHRLENLARFPWLDRYKAITSLCNTLEKLGAVIKMHSKSLYHSVKSLYISRKWTKSSETNRNVRANPFGKLKRSLEQRLSQALLVR